MSPLELPEVPYEHLSQPPLKAMLGQVRFPAILSVTEAEFVAPLQEAIRSEFPDLSPEQEIGLEVTPEGDVATETSRRWRFVSADALWSVVLAPDFLTLEANTGQYTDFDQFISRFEFVWQRTLSILRPGARLQQGLRYVNHIPADGPDAWRRLINPDLLGPFTNALFADELASSLTDMRLARPNGTLALKHGIVKAGPDQTLGYLLDFDYLTQERTSDVGTEGVLSLFREYHAIIYRLFRWSVTEEALELFRQGGGDSEP